MPIPAQCQQVKAYFVNREDTRRNANKVGVWFITPRNKTFIEHGLDKSSPYQRA